METGAGRCWSLNRGSARAQLFWEEFCKTRTRRFLSCKWETEKTFTWIKLSSPWSSPWILLCAWNPNSTVWDQVSVYCKVSLCVPELRHFTSSYLPLSLTAHCQCCLSQVSVLGPCTFLGWLCDITFDRWLHTVTVHCLCVDIGAEK